MHSRFIVIVTDVAAIGLNRIGAACESDDPNNPGDRVRSGPQAPSGFAEALGPYAARFGLGRGEGLVLLAWLLDLVAAPDVARWLRSAGADCGRTSPSAAGDTAAVPRRIGRRALT